jgi:23S rRNA (guanosine2251-2'-O)-methyltransferase
MDSESQSAVLWGLHEVAEALEAGHPVDRIYFSLQAKGPLVDRIKDLARQRRVRFDFVEVGKLGQLAGTRQHQEVVARTSPVHYHTLVEVLAAAPPTCTLLALDQVHFAGNLGLAIRTAAGAGATALLLPARGGTLVNGEVVKAASGAVFRLPLVSSANLAKDLLVLKEQGFWVYGLEAGSSSDFFSVDWPPRRVLVAGNETRGLRPLIRKTCDALVQIPLAGSMDSLNVAVALGVVLFDIVRKEKKTRWQPSSTTKPLSSAR